MTLESCTNRPHSSCRDAVRARVALILAIDLRPDVLLFTGRLLLHYLLGSRVGNDALHTHDTLFGVSLGTRASLRGAIRVEGWVGPFRKNLFAQRFLGV